MNGMKRGVYLLLAVIWALGAWAWIANVMRCAETGMLNGFHILTAVCSVICVVLNLFIYFQMGKKEK